MRAVHWMFVLRSASLLALSLSLALLLDYLSPDMAFCSQSSGCGAVRASGLGYLPLPGVGPVPFLPLAGLGTFGFIFIMSVMAPAHVRRKIVPPLAHVTAVGAVALLALQAFYIGQFCSLCVVVDLSALLIAAAAYCLRNEGWEIGQTEEASRVSIVDVEELTGEGSRVRGVWLDDSQVYDAPNSLVKPAPPDPLRLKSEAWSVLLSIALAAPLLFPRVVQVSETPGVIRELYLPDRVNIVEFFDFECPHCRMLSPVLEPIVERAGPDVRLVALPIALPGHKLGERAAHLWACSAKDKRDALRKHLLEAPVLSLSLVEAAKAQTGRDDIDACLASEEPGRVLAEIRARLNAAEFVGLPTVYVGGIRILGADLPEKYQDAIDKVRSGSDTRGVPGWAYWLAVLAAVGVTIFLGRVQRHVVVLSRPS